VLIWGLQSKFETILFEVACHLSRTELSLSDVCSQHERQKVKNPTQDTHLCAFVGMVDDVVLEMRRLLQNPLEMLTPEVFVPLLSH
jgi:hypothetical protein